MENNQSQDQVSINQQPLLTAAEVSYRLNLSRSCTYNLMQSGLIPTVHIGKSRRVRFEDLEAYIRKNLHSSQDLN